MAGEVEVKLSAAGGEYMESATVVEWLRATGEAVEAGAPLVVVETSKAAAEIEAPASGTLAEIRVSPGEEAPLMAVLGIISTTDEVAAAAAMAGAATEGAPSPLVAAARRAAAGRRRPERAAGGGFVPASPMARRLARELGLDLALVVGTGPGGRIGEKDVRAAARAAGPATGVPVPLLVAAGGRDISVLTMGQGDGAPIVLLHGFGGDLGVWHFNQARLAADRVTHAIELPAHGRSGLDVGDGSLEALAAMVSTTLDALGAVPCHLVGHSLGGGIALEIALEQPARVRSLTLIAPVGLGPGIEMAFIDGLLAAASPSAAKAALGLLFTDAFTIRRRMVDDMLKHLGKAGVREELRTIADAAFAGGRQATSFRGRLGALPMPVQAIWGAGDRILPPIQAEGLGAGVAVHVLEGAGHMPQMERPDEVNDLIRSLAQSSEDGG